MIGKRTGFLAGLALALWASSAGAVPVITNVVETGGDNEPTDTILAKWTGVTYNTTIANEPLLATPVGTPYTVPVFGHNVPSFVDRAHRYVDSTGLTYVAPTTAGPAPIPSYLAGGELIMSGNDNRDNPGYQLAVTVSTPVLVFMLIDNRLTDGDANTPPTFGPANMQWILDEGWIPVATGSNRFNDLNKPDEVAFDEGANNTIEQLYSVYLKDYPAGTFTLRQADNTGRNMYGAVVVGQVIPEPSTFALAALGLGGLFVARRRRNA